MARWSYGQWYHCSYCCVLLTFLQPYPGNPSFAPPPPLSDRTQDRIYRDLRAGGQTVTALSVKYQVSKARIEAVQQLKEIESEFLRQVSHHSQLFLPAPHLG